MNGENLFERYNCGPVKLTGNSDALDESPSLRKRFGTLNRVR
jgi:hypothetical protein